MALPQTGAVADFAVVDPGHARFAGGQNSRAGCSGKLQKEMMMRTECMAAMSAGKMQMPHGSLAIALSCQRRSKRWETSDNAKKIAIPVIDSSISAANMRAMLRRYADSAIR